MRLVIQRVKTARVLVENTVVGSIGNGLFVLIGIEEKDDETDIQWLVGKLINMRILSDELGKMNMSVKDLSQEIMVVSQFTLHAKTSKGNRPSFIQAAKPEVAIPLYETFLEMLESELNRSVPRGVFGADMQIELCLDGPVTITIDSKMRE